MRAPFFTLFGFRRPREAVNFSLGRLERAAMEEVWRRGEASAGDLHRDSEGRAAYTTWMTTLDRLFKKGLLTRRKVGRAYVYAPSVSREEFERGVAAALIDELLGAERGGAEPLLACIVETISERDRALLDELSRLVEEKRRAWREEE